VEAAARKKALEEGGPKVKDDFEEPDWFDDWKKGNSSFDPGEEANVVFRKYSKFKRELIKKTSKPYVAIRMPVVAIPKSGSFPIPEKIQRSGLCDDVLFGSYPVIKNQVLVGLNNLWLRENFAEGVKKPQSLMQDPDKDKDFKLDYAKALDKILADIRERTGRKYIFMEGVHSFQSADLHWAWAISEQDMRRLNGVLSGLTTFSINDWTLPFEQTMSKVKHRR
jgi:hypothetical protein